MNVKTVIRGGCVLTLAERLPNFAEADVLIEDGIVSEVGTGLSSRGADVIDAAGTIVMPGFVDGHRHVWKSLFRNSGDLGPIDRLADHLGPDDLYAATLIGLLGAVESGTTTVADWCDVQPTDEHTEAALQAHRDSGLRTVFTYHGTAMPGERGSLTTPALGWGVSTDSNVEFDWGRAKGSGLPVHVHAPDSQGLGARLAAEGVLGEDVTLMHGTRFDDGDFDAIASTGTAIVITPAAEMANSKGVPPLQGLIDRRIRPGLGVDDDVVAPGDMFAQMRSANSIQHAALFDLKLAGKGGVPNLLTTREVIRYATGQGARSLGLGSVTGSIEPGKRADVIVIRGDRPNIAPINDPIGAVVWGVDTSNIDWVIVDGRPLLREGNLDGDVLRARSLASEAVERVLRAAGLVLAADEGGQS